MAWPPPGPQWPRLMRGVLSQSTFSLPSFPTLHPLSGALTRHRPIRGRFVDSPGCSLGVVLISQRPYAKLTRSPIRVRSPSSSFHIHVHASFSFILSLSLLPFSPPLTLSHTHSLSLLAPSILPFSRSLLPPRWTTSNHVDTLIACASSEPLSSKRTFARVRRTTGKNDNFSWSPRVMRTFIRRARPVLAHGVGTSWYFEEPTTQFG